MWLRDSDWLSVSPPCLHHPRSGKGNRRRRSESMPGMALHRNRGLRPKTSGLPGASWGALPNRDSRMTRCRRGWSRSRQKVKGVSRVRPMASRLLRSEPCGKSPHASHFLSNALGDQPGEPGHPSRRPNGIVLAASNLRVLQRSGVLTKPVATRLQFLVSSQLVKS